SGLLEQAASSPHGLAWIDMPFSNTEGWKRLTDVSPHFTQRTATVGVGISEQKPVRCVGVPYPVLLTYTAEPDVVYNVTKAIDLQAPVYSKAQSGTAGWAAKSQAYEWVVPYNEGAIKYFKEVGTWDDTKQKRNDSLVARGKVLQSASKK